MVQRQHRPAGTLRDGRGARPRHPRRFRRPGARRRVRLRPRRLAERDGILRGRPDRWVAVAASGPGADPRRYLDGLTEPLEEAEADRGTGEDEEGEVDVITALVPDDQPTAAGDPGQGTLDHPSMPAEALAALDPAPGDARDDAAPAAGAAAAGVGGKRRLKVTLRAG